jgi:TonB family protein
MRNILLGTILLSACATATLPRELDSSGSHAHLQLQLASSSSTSDTAQAMQPTAIDPTLPSADRIASQLRAEIGERVSSQIRMCVAPNGAVKHVVIVRSSSSPSFDRAVLHDSAAWKFKAMPGPANLVSCGDATIVYGTH